MLIFKNLYLAHKIKFRTQYEIWNSIFSVQIVNFKDRNNYGQSSCKQLLLKKHEKLCFGYTLM